jgi:hypothetical protein
MQSNESLMNGKNWYSLRWCLPTLLGFLAFLFAFPIDRRIPHWFPLNLAEVSAAWFLFVTPVTTAIAIVTLIKRNRRSRVTPPAKLITWSAIALSFVLNAVVLLGLWASTY